MAEVTFYYGTMNCGKSAAILQQNYNLKNSGFKPFLCKSSIDNRHSDDKIVSRIGIEHHCKLIGINDHNIKTWFKNQIDSDSYTHFLIDEVQFLNYYQTHSLYEIADKLNIPVYAYGLRTSWKGELFVASSILFALADNLIELPTIYKDGNKTVTHIKMKNNKDFFDMSYSNIEVGDMDSYESVSRKEYTKRRYS